MNDPIRTEPYASLRPVLPERRQVGHAFISPTVASEILEHEVWNRQRPLRPAHIEALLRALRAGELVDLVLLFCQTPDRRRHLIDGQHRLVTIVKGQVGLPAVVITYFVRDEDEIEQIYLTIDRHSRRTPEDMLVAAGLMESLPLPPDKVKRVARAALIAHSGFVADYKRAGLSLIVRRDAVVDWMGAGEIYAAAIHGARHEVGSKLWRAPVAAVGMATLRDVIDGAANEFWEGIARDNGLIDGDPRKTLLAWLRGTPVASKGSEMEYLRHVARAWNAWYEGRTLTKLQDSRSRGRLAPLPILGTRYHVG